MSDDDFFIPVFSFDDDLPKPEPEPEPKPEPKHELTDDEVDDMFADITAGVDRDETVIAAAAKVIEAEAIITEAIAKREAEEAEYAKLKKEEEALQAALRAINKRLAEAKTRLFDVRQHEREAVRKRDEKQHGVEIAKQAIIARRKYDASERNYIRLATGKAWWEGLADGRRILNHQWTGARFLASSGRAILGDGMGLGKTLTAIAALDLVESKRALVICPSDVASNFVDEIRDWAPHRLVLSMRGMNKEQRKAALLSFTMIESFVCVINYEIWRRDHDLVQSLVDLGFDTIILDESHNIKTTSSEAYKGCEDLVLGVNTCPNDETRLLRNGGHAICPKCLWQGQGYPRHEGEDRLAHMLRPRSVKYLWTMTGTPILNNPADLYAPLSLIDPANFYNKNSFLRTYCYLDPYTNRWRFLDGGLDLLQRRLKGRFLARTLDDTDIELPPQFPTIHEVEIDGERYPLQLRTIQQLTKYAQIVLSDGRAMTPMVQIALITRQRQANVWPGGIKVTDPDTKEIVFQVSDEVRESIKIDKAIEIIVEAVEDGKRVALFSQFTTALAELQSRIDGFTTESGKVIRSVRFDGQTPDGLKDEIKRNFNKARGEEAKWDVVLANYKTGGVGLNLTAAAHTIILDEEWNPGKRDQAYKRTHRLGQDETTFVHVIRIPQTIDTWLMKLIEEKANMIAGFNESTMDIQAELLAAIERGEIGGPQA